MVLVVSIISRFKVAYAFPTHLLVCNENVNSGVDNDGARFCQIDSFLGCLLAKIGVKLPNPKLNLPLGTCVPGLHMWHKSTMLLYTMSVHGMCQVDFSSYFVPFQYTPSGP